MLWTWCELPHQWDHGGHRTTSDPASATTCQCDFFYGKSIILHCYPQTPNKLLHVIHTHSSHGLNSRIDNCESSRNHKGLMRQLDFSHHIAEARICKHHIDLGLRPRTGWDQNDSTSPSNPRDISQETLNICGCWNAECWISGMFTNFIIKFALWLQMWNLSSHKTILQHQPALSHCSQHAKIPRCPANCRKSDVWNDCSRVWCEGVSHHARPSSTSSPALQVGSFYPGTLEMFRMVGKHWIIFSTSCVMIWHILYL